FVVARRNGARYVRVTVAWSRVAPAGAAKPAGFDAADPESPGYNWGSIEDAVRSAAARQLKVVLTIVRAPAWAEGPRRPAGAPPGATPPRVCDETPAGWPPSAASSGCSGAASRSG